jgi:hypothetical protein
MVDMEQELLPKYTHPIMKAALNFIDKHIKINNVLTWNSLWLATGMKIS